MGHELDETTRARLQRLSGRCDNFEVYSSSRTRGDTIDLPRCRLADTNFGLANTGRFLAGRDSVSDHARNPQLFRRLNVERSIEAHLEIAVGIFIEHAEVRLLEDRRGEGVGEDDDTVR